MKDLKDPTGTKHHWIKRGDIKVFEHHGGMGTDPCDRSAAMAKERSIRNQKLRKTNSTRQGLARMVNNDEKRRYVQW
jgi:hypothetical protein